MATYVTLSKWTAQGLANIKDSPDRLDAAREQLAPLGVTIKDFYLTLGEYDFLVIVEAPDNKAAAMALIGLGAQGNVSTTSMAALTEQEFRSIIAEMP